MATIYSADICPARRGADSGPSLNKAASSGRPLVAFRDFLQQRGKLKERLMWRDYVGLIPSSAAIVNGFIAVLIAQFFKDRPIARAVLVGFAFVLGGAAIGATF
jgi:hypothetical protein